MKSLVVLAVFASTAHADGLAGSWRGTWTKAGDALAVDTTFTAAGSGWFDADARLLGDPQIAWARGTL